jgi:thioredoxin-related protein
MVLNFGVGTAAGNGPADIGELRKPTVLVFGLGSRCRYCVQLKKEIGRVTEEIGDAVRFQDILVDHDKRMVHQYRVLLSPTLVFLDAAGTEVFRHQGILNAQQILEHLVALEFWPRKG